MRCHRFMYYSFCCAIIADVLSSRCHCIAIAVLTPPIIGAVALPLRRHVDVTAIAADVAVAIAVATTACFC